MGEHFHHSIGFVLIEERIELNIECDKQIGGHATGNGNAHAHRIDYEVAFVFQQIAKRNLDVILQHDTIGKVNLDYKYLDGDFAFLVAG